MIKSLFGNRFLRHTWPVLGLGAALPLAGAPVTTTWQQGADDYQGVTEIRLRKTFEQYGDSSLTIFLDGGADAYGDQDLSYGYIHFDGLFGSDAGQIPTGSHIVSARLTVTTGRGNNDQSGSFFSVAALVLPLPAPEEGVSLLNSFPDAQGFAGPDYVDGHIERPTSAFRSPNDPVQRLDQGEQAFVDVTEIIQNWANAPEANNGFVISPVASGLDGWAFFSSNEGNAVEDRPRLEITYLPPDQATAYQAVTQTFRQGLDDYEGTISAWLCHTPHPGTAADRLTQDGASLTGPQYLDGPNGTDSPDDQLNIAFTNIFGNDPGQIKPDPTLHIERAVLKLTTGPSGNAYSPGPGYVHQLLKPFYVDDGGLPVFRTWEDYQSEGPTETAGEIAPALGAFYGLGFNQKSGVDITELVRAWATGEPNYGINVQLGTSDGWQIYFPGASLEDARPELVVSYYYEPDRDGDGLPDEWEVANGTNPEVADADADPDGDGLTNAQEYALGTRANLADTDGDGLSDGAETNTGVWVSATDTGTDPRNPDTDGDGLPDGKENPTQDFVGVDQPGTDPNKADTDGDGWPDYSEALNGANPKVAASVPTFTYQIVLAENFDGESVASTYGLLASGTGEYQPATATSESESNQTVVRLTDGTANAVNSIVWNTVPTQAKSVRLTFDYSLSADTELEVADGFGFGLFRTSVYGTTGADFDPLASPKTWEDPRTSGGVADAVHLGFDIYSGLTEGNNIRLSGPARPGTALVNYLAPFPLNNGLFNRVILTAVANGTSTVFRLEVIEAVNGEAPVTHVVFPALIVPEFDISTEQVRLIAGARTGSRVITADLDNFRLETGVPAIGPIDPEPPAVEPVITAVTIDDSATPPVLKITWTSAVGLTYKVESSSTLAANEWATAADDVAGTAGTTTFEATLPAEAPSALYYRIERK